MTRNQRIQHKIGNQKRKLAMLARNRNLPKGQIGDRELSVIQDGRYTKKP